MCLSLPTNVHVCRHAFFTLLVNIFHFVKATIPGTRGSNKLNLWKWPKSYPKIVRIDDGRLDLVEDHRAAPESADDEAHGGPLATREPFHRRRQGWNQSDVLEIKWKNITIGFEIFIDISLKTFNLNTKAKNTDLPVIGLYRNTIQNMLVNWIIRLLLSFLYWPKLILLAAGTVIKIKRWINICKQLYHYSFRDHNHETEWKVRKKYKVEQLFFKVEKNA